MIAHTRFATSSANKVTELHPHEWTPFREELVWRFNPILGKYERSASVMGVHITHNGDFDELEAYLQVRIDVAVDVDMGADVLLVVVCCSTAIR